MWTAGTLSASCCYSAPVPAAASIGRDECGGSHWMALPVSRVLDNPPEELHDELGSGQRSVVRGDVDQRIHLDQVETDDFPALGDREQRVPKLVIRQTIQLRG